MEQAHATPYRVYWTAWVVLLALTVLMVSLDNPTVLVAGVVAKASIIVLWFMHLRQEKLDLGLAVVVSIVFTGAVLFGLIAPDGSSM